MPALISLTQQVVEEAEDQSDEFLSNVYINFAKEVLEDHGVELPSVAQSSYDVWSIEGDA
jgi:hypothetical protein